MRPEQFSVVYQDTDAGPWDAGASGSQTTFNNGRAVVAAADDVREQLLELAEEALEAARADLELVDGRRAGQGLARHRRRHRRARLDRGRRQAPARARLGLAGAAARLRRLGVHRPAGDGVVPRADVHHPRGALQGRSRHRRRARARGRGRPRVGPRPQPDGRRRAGRGRRRDGDRHGALGGLAALGRRPPAQPLPARLQAADGGGRPADQRRLGRGARPRRRAERRQGASASRRACRRRGRSETRSRRSPAASTSCR